MVYLPGMRHANQMHEPAKRMLTLLAGLLSHGGATNVACRKEQMFLIGKHALFPSCQRAGDLHSAVTLEAACLGQMPHAPPTGGDVHHADALQYASWSAAC